MSMSESKMSYNYTAVYAKCRAKSATLLTAENYIIMAGMKNLGEIATYLVQNSDYAEQLSGTNINEIHRSELETLLHENLF